MSGHHKPYVIQAHILLPIGHDVFVQADKILMVCPMDRLTFRRMVQSKNERGHVIDATAGRKRRSVIVLHDDERVILTTFSPDALLKRLNVAIEKSTP